MSEENDEAPASPESTESASEAATAEPAQESAQTQTEAAQEKAPAEPAEASGAEPSDETVGAGPAQEKATASQQTAQAESAQESAAAEPAQAGAEPAEQAASVTTAIPDAASAWGTPAPADGQPASAPPPSAEDERRTAQRKGVRLNKLISASLNSGTSLYLHLVDISEGGMRVNGDLEFNQAEPFTLTLQMEAFGKDLAEEHPHLALDCRVVWQKRLLGGMFVSGLQFVDMTPENQMVVKKILERSSPEGRRLRFRLNRVLGVGIGLDEETRWLYPLALDLSVEGMRLRLDEEIEVGSIFPLQIFLEFDLPTVRVQAEAVWREEVGNGRYQVGLRFTEVSEESAKAIQEYIDRCLAKESKV